MLQNPPINCFMNVYDYCQEQDIDFTQVSFVPLLYTVDYLAVERAMIDAI